MQQMFERFREMKHPLSNRKSLRLSGESGALECAHQTMGSTVVD